MKKVYTFTLALGLLYSANAQTTSTFEENVLADSSYYDGSDGAGGFSSGNAYFSNYFDFGYWLGGWAYSNIYDTVTQPADFMTQLFNAKEFNDEDEKNFAIGTQGSILKLTGAAIGKSLGSFDITNTTFAYNSMKLGDGIGKKFGGASGNDPDYFKLVIKKYLGGTLATDSVEFYLADFRFADNTQDYIVKEWNTISLTSLGNVDSLLFIMRSTDVGSFGINTPTYYCIDNFVTNNSPTAVAAIVNETALKVYPNPSVNFISIETGEQASVYNVVDMAGHIVRNGHFNDAVRVDVSALQAGIYYVQANGKTVKFVKH